MPSFIYLVAFSSILGCVLLQVKYKMLFINNKFDVYA